MTESGYFDALYAASADPWDLASSLYERRKLALLMGSLPALRYRSAFEPGCAIGVTTVALAGRCDRLLSMDGAAAAVTQASARIAVRGLAERVSVVRGLVPADWPDGSFDLLVLSELLYYLDADARLAVASRAAESLAPGGDIAAVHWRPGFAEAETTGDQVCEELLERLGERGLRVIVDHVEEEFRLLVFRR